jgi:hypothetical protein
MKIDGGCHCGAIAYEAEVDPETVSICHCTDCQHLSGSVYRTSVQAKREALQFLKGRPKEYVKTAQSGAKRAQGFCADCGTPIYSGDPGGNSPVYFIRAGSVRQRAQLVPRRQIWCSSRLPWLPEAGLPSLDKQ